MQTGEGIFVNSRCFHYGYSDAHTECLFICILLSPLLLSVNTYFVENCLNPLLQNIHFPYQKLNPSIQWQNSILHDLKLLYEKNMDKIQPFFTLEKTVHIFRLLAENMNYFPDYDKDTEDILVLTAMIGYVQKNYPNKILLKDISSSGNCCKTKCTSLFQKYLNTSPMVYLNRSRLEKSVFLLPVVFQIAVISVNFFISIIIQRRASFASIIDKHYSYCLTYNHNGYFLIKSPVFTPVFHIASNSDIAP